MISKANIVGLYRLDMITYVTREDKVKIKFRPMLYGVASIAIVLVLLVGMVYGDNGSILKDMMTIYSPITSLYSDKNNLSFTAGGLVYSEELDFTLPMLSTKINIVKGNVMIECDKSVMVSSIESGIVEDINYTLDDIKYIKIRHGVDIYSIIENMDIVSVNIGDVIEKNQSIGVAIEGSSIILKIYREDTLIDTVKIVGNSIKIY